MQTPQVCQSFFRSEGGPRLAGAVKAARAGLPDPKSDTPPAMVYALLGGLAWASLDAWRRRLAASMGVVALSAWLNGGAVPVFLAWAWLGGAGLPDAGWLLPGLGSIVVGLVAQLLFLLALRWAGLSATIPMLALTPALSTLFAWLALGELPNPSQSAGLLLIVGGCLANGVLAGRGRASASAPRPAEGVAAMAGVAALWSANGVIDKVALLHAPAATHATIVAATTFGLLLGGLAAQGRGSELLPRRADGPALAGATVTLGLAYGLQLLALAAVPVGLVEGVKRGLGVPAAQVSGWALFGEPVAALRVAAALVVVVGLVLL